MSHIAVIGAGAFGTALAIAMAQAGARVLLWTRDPAHARAMADSRENAARLPGLPLPPGLAPTASLADLAVASVGATLLVLPAQATGGFLASHASALPDAPLVLCAKGLDAVSHDTQTDVAARHTALPLAVLTGPGFADEIARGLPTALTLAAFDPRLGRQLQHLLSTERLRLYLSDDPIGAQLGGALKNVVALAAGLAIGAGLGESARAALITRGFAEIRRLGHALGAGPDTFAGLSGLGDLALTCASERSRNFAAGLALGRGQPLPAGQTTEGLATAGAAVRLGARAGVDLPIATAVHDIVAGRITLQQAVARLLSRPLRPE